MSRADGFTWPDPVTDAFDLKEAWVAPNPTFRGAEGFFSHLPTLRSPTAETYDYLQAQAPVASGCVEQ